MIAGGITPPQPEEYSSGWLLAYVELPGKPRTYVRLVDQIPAAGVLDFIRAHRFETEAEAIAVLERLYPKAHDAGLTGVTSVARAARAANRTRRTARLRRRSY